MDLRHIRRALYDPTRTEDRPVADIFLRDAPYRPSDPYGVPIWLGPVQRVVATAAVTTISVAGVRQFLVPAIPETVAGAIGIILGILLSTAARWWWHKLISPLGDDLARFARLWLRNWRIDQAFSDGVISDSEALEEKRRLFFAAVREGTEGNT